MRPQPAGNARPPFQRPPAAATYSAVIERGCNSAGAGPRGDVGALRVTVNGSVVEPGTHTAQVLGLLGVNERDLYEAWYSFAVQQNQIYVAGMLYDETATHQGDGAGWKIFVEVLGGQVHETADLAYVDLKQVKRTVTYKAKVWNPVTDGMGNLTQNDLTENRTSTWATKIEPLDDGAAVGSFFSGVDQYEIDSTVKAAHALQAAREDLEKALDEIETAIKVAGTAWKGGRAQVAMTKFALEHEMVTGLATMAHGWEDFTQDVVRQQRVAKQHDDHLKAEIKKELAIDAVVGVITLGAGALIKGAFFVGKMVAWAEEVAALRVLMKSSFVAAVGRISRTSTGVFAIRATARGVADWGTRTTIGAATGQPNTMSWYASFLLAGVGGQATSEGAKRLLAIKNLEQRLNVTIFGATKGGVQGVPRVGLSAIPGTTATDAALGFTMGIPSEAAKETLKDSVRSLLVRQLQADPVAQAAARQSVMTDLGKLGRHTTVVVGGGKYTPRQVSNDPALIAKLVAKETKAQATRRLDPILDAAFTSGGLLARQQITSPPDLRGNPTRPGAPTPGGSNGLVRRPMGTASIDGRGLGTDSAPVKTFTYTVGNGDTLSALAQRYLGNGAHWPDIQRYNPGIDPSHLTPGDTILIPKP
jgi:hypothetical protein